MNTVYPSGADLAAACAPIIPLAPGLSSTTTRCLVSLVISCAATRASVSVALPAANGTTKVTGFSGYSAAVATLAARTRMQIHGTCAILNIDDLPLEGSANNLSYHS